MKRSAFLAAIGGLFGVARAQRWRECKPYPGSDPQVCTDENKPALNGECPVCGEMAGKYPGPGGAYDCGFYAGHPPMGSGCPGSVNLVRCKRCNAAFWQDAEK